jgi:hypothetical protein
MSWARPDPQGDFHALDDPYSSCSRSVFLCPWPNPLTQRTHPPQVRSPERQHVQRRYDERQDEQEKDVQIGKNEENSRQDVNQRARQ